MSKVGGSYESVVRGVSEQVAQDRRPGQHEAQVNLISDPVRGLARRWGTVWQSELALGSMDFTGWAPSISQMREYTFTINGVEYCLLYRNFPSNDVATRFCWCYNKDANTFIPVNIQTGSAFINALTSGGASAIASVGRYLYIAGNTTTPTYTATDQYASFRNYGVAWVRTGAYSRTYTVSITTSTETFTASYTTKASAYPVLNDTSGIPFYTPGTTTPDPEYQKKINDANNLYNSNVTKWIGDAARDITPENIATQLAVQLQAHFGASTVGVVGSTIVWLLANFQDATSTDGADNTGILCVGNEVSGPDKLSSRHQVGKIVRVRPQGASAKEAYYMRADAKSGAAGGWAEVIWREAPGVLQQPQTVFAMAAFANGFLHIAQDPAALRTMTGDTSHPSWKPSTVGDLTSSPVPNFFGKRITMLSVFQDRLIIGADGVVNASRPGDYLNFYRNTVLQVQDDDPVEMYSYGAEGDILRYTNMFDSDMVIFGDLKQYAISGRAVLTPKSPNIRVMSSHEDSTQAAPQEAGNLVFYGKQREGRTSVHQLQIGQLTESPESVEITQQLDTYLQGKPSQIISLTSPNTLIFRTETLSNGFYVYNYIDTPAGSERVFDSWSRWEFAAPLGYVIGVSPHKGEALIFMLRAGANGLSYLVCDRQTLSTELSSRPYMDSMRPYSNVGTGWHSTWTTGAQRAQFNVALDKTHDSFLFGDTWNNAARLITQIPGATPALWVGVNSPAYVTPTNPFMRDSNGKAIVDGRLTLTHVTPSLSNTGGLTVTVEKGTMSDEWTNFSGRVMGDGDNLIGKQPLITDKLVVGIGAESRECSFTIATRDWLPLTVTALGWTGQYFNRIRRVG